MLKKIYRNFSNNLFLYRKFSSKILDNDYIQNMYKLWTADPKNVHETWDMYFRNILFSDSESTKQLIKTIKKIPTEVQKTVTDTKQNTDSQNIVDIKLSTDTKSERPKIPKKLTQTQSFTSDSSDINKISNYYGHTTKEPEAPAEDCKRTDVFNFPTIEVIESKKYDLTNKITFKQDLTTLTDCSEDTWLFLLCRKYQNYGHFLAKTDPLEYTRNDVLMKYRMAIEHTLESLKEKIQADKECYLSSITNIGGQNITLPFKEIVKRLEKVYTSSMGIQTRQNNRIFIKKWIQKKVEYPTRYENVTPLEKLIALKRLINTTGFDKFVAKNWPNEVSYGFNGLESVIPALGQIIDTASSMGVTQVLIGMEHQGRLNVIANILKIPLRRIFALYGDPKGNLTMGTSNQFLNLTSEKHIRVSISPSSSHVEYAGPNLMGKAKALISQKNDLKGKSVLPIVIHEDSAFSGQGVCFETVRFDQLPLYTPFGTIHVVLNDYMTTSTHSSSTRSTIYPTAVSFVNEAPVFHVNGDDIESVLYAAKLCAEIRQRFQADVILDVVGYIRDMGNLQFVEPIMYSKINQMEPVMDKFYAQLKNEKIVTESEYKMFKDDYDRRLKEEFAKSGEEKPDAEHWIDSPWKSFFQGTNLFHCDATGIHEQTIYHTGKKLAELPLKYDLHPQVVRVLQKRKELIKERLIDWVLAEGVAFGSLLKMGIPVRLSGSQVAIGTFNQRHHILYHQTKDKVEYHPLSNIYPDQAEYLIINSPDAVNGTLAYEVGLSTISPKLLVVWEATYGDRVNLAQTVIDNYIASGEAKWRRQSGLVLLLPHGMEREGAERSNARPERFLCLCNDDPELLPTETSDVNFNMKQLYQCNIIVANCTTPANYFHILRRQILLPFRKPLILFTPKSMINNSLFRSSFEDIIYPTEFKRIISEFDESASKDQFDNVVKLIFCSGSVYYDLMEEREMRNLNEQISIVRIEQLAPFPYDLLKVELEKYKNVKQIAWAQEEHRNHGPWYFIEPRLQYLGVEKLQYIGRLTCAVPADAYESRFIAQRNAFLIEAMKI